jgi:hypothetical protein
MSKKNNANGEDAASNAPNHKRALTGAELDRIEQKLDEIMNAQPDTFWASDVVDELATHIRTTFGLAPQRAFTTANAFVTARYEYDPRHLPDLPVEDL